MKVCLITENSNLEEIKVLSNICNDLFAFNFNVKAELNGADVIIINVEEFESSQSFYKKVKDEQLLVAALHQSKLNKYLDNKRIDAFVIYEGINKAHFKNIIDQGQLNKFQRLKRSKSQVDIKNLYSLSIQSLEAGIWEWEFNEGNPHEWWSDKVYELLGYKKNEIAPSQEMFESIIHPDDIENWYAEKARFAKAKDKFRVIGRAYKKNGDLIFIDASGIGEFDESGNLYRVVGTIQDVTKYKIYENKIVEQERITREILNAFPFDIAIYNPDFTYQFVNKKAVPEDNLRSQVVGLDDFYFFEKKKIDKSIAENRMLKLKEASETKRKVNFIEVFGKGEEKSTYLKAIHPIFENNKLRRLVCTSLDLTKELNIERDLKFRVNFDSLLMNLSYSLINISIDEVEKVIGEGLEKIGKLIKADRVFIFRYNSTRTRMSNTHEWVEKRVNPVILRKQNISISDFKEIEKTLRKGEVYIVNDVDELKGPSSAEKEHLLNEGIKSVILAPLVVNRERSGFIGFESIHEKRHWSEEIKDLLKLSAQIISSAIERKSSLNTIVNSEEKFRTLSEKAHAAIFITRDSRFVYANPETCRLTGFSHDEILTKNYIELLDEDERVDALEIQEKIMVQAEFSNRKERKLRTKCNEDKYIDVASNRIFYNGENAIISIAIDVTEKHKKEKERIELIDQLINQNQDLGQFSYIVSHNLRSPVAGIKGLISIIDKGSIENDLNIGILNRIEASASKLDRIIKDLNEIISVKKSSGIAKQNLNFNDLLIEFKESHSELIEENNAIINHDFSQVTEVNSIRGYLTSILTNLLTNAIKYHKPDFAPVITLYTQKTDGFVELFVQDNGLGLDLEKHGEKLFRFKQRFHLSIAGHGIGLYLVKTQAEAIGGSVSVQSEVNKGSTFVVKIPV